MKVETPTIPEKLLSFACLVALDSQNNLIYATNSAKKLLGKDYKLEIGKSFFAKDYSPNSKIILEMSQQAQRDGFKYIREVPRGKKIYAISAYPTKINDLPAAVVMFDDVTEIRQKDKENMLLYHITSTMTSDLPIKDIADKILGQVVGIMGLQGGSIMLVDRIRGILFTETSTRPEIIKEINIGEGVSGFVARTGQPLSFIHTNNEKRYLKAEGENDKSLLSMPIMTKGQIFGVLNLWKPAGEYFMESEVQTYSVIATNIAEVLDVKKLRSIADKRLELAKILDSTLDIEPMLDRAIYKTSEILENTQASIYLWRSDNLLEWFASSHHQASEFKGQYLPLVKRDVMETFKNHQSSVLNLKYAKNIRWVKDLVNRKGWEDTTVSGLIIKGKLYGLLFLHNAKFNPKEADFNNLVYDLSSQLSLAVENAKLYSQSKKEVQILDSIQTTTDQGIMLLDSDKNIVYTNRAVDKIFSLKKSTAGVYIGKFAKNFPTFSKFKIKRAASLIETMKKNMEVGFSTNIEISDGKNRKNLTLTLKVLNQGPYANYLITIDDITKLKKLQDQLASRLQQTTQLFKISSFNARQQRHALNRIIEHLPELLQAEESHMLIASNHELQLLNPKAAGTKWKNFAQNIINTPIYDYLKNNKGYFAFPKKNFNLSTPPDLRNFIIFPIIVSAELQGAIFVANKKIEKHFTGEDIRLFSIAAKQISSILENNALLQEIQLEKDRLSAIIKHSADGMILVDHKQNIISWNKAMERLSGYSQKQTVGKNVDSFIKLPGENSFIKFIYEKTGNHLHASLPETQILDKNNESRWLDIHIAKPIEKEKSKFGELAILFNDVSKYKELDQQKNEFISVTAHELRTPLTAIKGYLSMILDGDAGELTERQQKYFSRTYQSTERLVSLVEDLLNFLRLEEKRITFDPKPIDMTKIAKEVIYDLFQKASQKSLHIKLNDYMKSADKVFADPDRTKQILSNLIDNAIKYTPKGGNIVVKIHKASIGKKSYLITDVEDTGIGITDANIMSIFDKFQRISSPMSTQAGGYGLGLFITRSLVEQQGGEIWVKSQPGKGSVFSFSLPLADGKIKVNLNQKKG